VKQHGLAQCQRSREQRRQWRQHRHYEVTEALKVMWPIHCEYYELHRLLVTEARHWVWRVFLSEARPTRIWYVVTSLRQELQGGNTMSQQSF
jgi:hypothetical protein